MKRMSSLPREMGCPASASEPDIKIDSSTGPSIMGSCIHEVVVDPIRNDDAFIHKDHINELAAKYRVDNVKEVRILSYVAFRAYRENIRPHIDLDTLMIEEEVKFSVGGVKRVGHMDGMALSVDHETLIVWDWKSGFVETDALNQLKGYGLGALKLFPDVKNVTLVTVWLRSKTLDVVELTRKELEVDFVKELREAQQSNTYNPDPKFCTYCPKLQCPAKIKMNHSTINQLVEMADTEVVNVEEYAKSYDKILFLEKAIKSAKEAVKKHIKDNGRIKTDTGYLDIVEKHVDKIDLEKAMPTLAAFFVDEPLPNLKEVIDIIMPAISISKGRLLDIVGAHAPKGMKGKSKAFLMELLDKDDAVTVRVQEEIKAFKEAAE